MIKPTGIVVGVGAERGLGAALCRRFAAEGLSQSPRGCLARAPVLPGVDVFVRRVEFAKVNWSFGNGGRLRVVRSAFTPTRAATHGSGNASMTMTLHQSDRQPSAASSITGAGPSGIAPSMSRSRRRR